MSDYPNFKANLSIDFRTIKFIKFKSFNGYNPALKSRKKMEKDE